MKRGNAYRSGPATGHEGSAGRSLRARTRCAVILALAVLAAGCAAPAANTPSKKFSDLILYRYPSFEEPLQIRKLTAFSAAEVAPELQGKPVTVMVHPAYSLFFREENRSAFTEAKYDLLQFQLDSEARFISEIARTNNILILLLPGNFQKESIAPLSYTYYLNAAAGNSPTVYYLTTETWSTGSLSMDSMVTLYGFLKKTGAKKLLVGGGYIGRCQKDFYNQLTAYVDRIETFIVPEISSISPDDISEQDARDILVSLRQGDYAPVRTFIEKRGQGPDIILPLPPAPEI